MVELHTYSNDNLPSNLKCQILSFLRITFPDGFTGENLLRDWISRGPVVHLVLVDSGILISHTEVKWQYLEHAGERYKTYGLSGVLTYPAFRGKGCGQRIVEAGTRYIEQTDADIGLFHCSSHLKEFYVKCGWTPMEHTTTLKGDKNNPVVSDELMMMHFFSNKGKSGRRTFELATVYFGEDTW